MLAGCMDIVWSMAGVITAPWWNEREDEERVSDCSRHDEDVHVLIFLILTLKAVDSPLAVHVKKQTKQQQKNCKKCTDFGS